MEIRKTTKDDLDRVMELFADARLYMAENGNPNQWKTNHPPREIIEKDIEEGKSHVCVENGKILGTFFLTEGPDPTYAKIIEGAYTTKEGTQVKGGAWIDDEKPYWVVHRITTDRNSRGVGSFCLNWAFAKHPNIRIDTHIKNKPMQGLLAKLGFKYCGIIFLANGEERIAFQKIQST